MPERLKLDKRNRAYVRVGAAATAVLTGADDVAEWDDEELVFGRRRGPSGKFGGQPPRIIPIECLRELTRRKIFDTESVIRDSIVDAAKYLAGVATGTEEPNADRQRAAQVLLERFLGKPTERHQVDAKVDMAEPAWLKAFRKAARTPDGRTVEEVLRGVPPKPRPVEPEDDIVDAEVVEDSWGIPPGAQLDPDPILTDDDPVLWDDDDFIEE